MLQTKRMKTRTFIGVLTVLTALGYFALQHNTRAASRVLPFQGQLKDAQGNPVPDGAKVVQFKIYDAPVGGQAFWNGEVQKLIVNSGLVSTLLGTKANLAAVDFNRDLYLELTIDANNDSQITAADPPLLPRQSILPTVFAIEASDSRKLAGEDWSALFGTNSPAGALLPTKIADGSLPGAKLAPRSITTTQIASNAITAGLLANGVISSNQIATAGIAGVNIAEASISHGKLAPRRISADAPEGGWWPSAARPYLRTLPNQSEDSGPAI